MENLEELSGKPEDIIETAPEDDEFEEERGPLLEPLRDFVERYPVVSGVLAYLALSTLLALRGLRR